MVDLILHKPVSFWASLTFNFYSEAEIPFGLFGVKNGVLFWGRGVGTLFPILKGKSLKKILLRAIVTTAHHSPLEEFGP